MVWPLIVGLGIAAATLGAKRIYMLSKTLSSHRYHSGFNSIMNREEALKILNLREPFNMRQIKDSHRQIMKINHPDSNGSSFLASKINEAKDLLSKEVDPIERE